jgi:hypothetical protein
MISSAFSLPADYPRVRQVSSFEELVAFEWHDGVNALCWKRELSGDFCEIAAALQVEEGITTIPDERLLALELSDAGKHARDILLSDQELLRQHDLLPSLDCIRGDLRDKRDLPICTDVYSWHADSATGPADTYLCSYNAPCSEGLRNEDAIRRIDVPETRARLLAEFGGAEGPEFLEYLTDHYYDLHYVPRPGARPFSFGLGNLWRITTDWPGCPVPPCIHRAPAMPPGRLLRLLLIS